MQTGARMRVGDLIVVLDVIDEGARFQIDRRRSALLSLPAVILTLIEVAPLQSRYELLRRALVIGVIGFGASGYRHAGRMVKVIVPQRVDTEAAAIGWPRHFRTLRFVFGDDNDATAASSVSCRSRDGFDDVFL